MNEYKVTVQLYSTVDCAVASPDPILRVCSLRERRVLLLLHGDGPVLSPLLHMYVCMYFAFKFLKARHVQNGYSCNRQNNTYKLVAKLRRSSGERHHSRVSSLVTPHNIYIVSNIIMKMLL